MTGSEAPPADRIPAPQGAERVLAKLAPADRVVLAYGALVLAIVLWRQPARWPLVALGQTALLAGVVLLTARGPGAKAAGWRFLHRWYPVMLLLVLYPQAGALRHLLVDGDLDPLVLRWEDALFPGRWWATSARLPPAAREAVLAAYFSYYLLLFVPALGAARRAPRRVAEYVSVVTFTLLLHFAASFLFPVAGPQGHAGLAAEGVFGRLVGFAYLLFDRGGLAFPSTHVAATVVACWYAGTFYPSRRWLYVLWAAAITASTVLGAFHYTIDAAAGLVTGAVCTALGGLWWRRAEGSVDDARAGT